MVPEFTQMTDACSLDKSSPLRKAVLQSVSNESQSQIPALDPGSILLAMICGTF